MREKILVALSGGIDSTASLLLLKEKGYKVYGITFIFWNEIPQIEKLKDFLKKIGVEYQVIDVREEFKKYILGYFKREYLKGRTPNPCALCNSIMKFRLLFKKLNEIKGDLVATGHYADIKKIGKHYLLSKAKDSQKSQEYFLARVKKELLPRIIFPLKDTTKEEIKEYIKQSGYEAPEGESQNVCFIKENEKYFEFLKREFPEDLKKDFSGYIRLKNGKILGIHKGYIRYTIGQRRGLGIRYGKPLYVIDIDPEKRDIIVGEKKDTLKTTFIIKDIYLYLPLEEIENPIEATVKIRYNHKGEKAKVELLNKDTAKITFYTPQSAITKGQLAVFYQEDIVLGSGWIEKVIN